MLQFLLVGVSFSPANSTVSWQNWNLSILIVIPCCGHMKRKSQAWWKDCSTDVSYRMQSPTTFTFFLLPGCHGDPEGKAHHDVKEIDIFLNIPSITWDGFYILILLSISSIQSSFSLFMVIIIIINVVCQKNRIFLSEEIQRRLHYFGEFSGAFCITIL